MRGLSPRMHRGKHFFLLQVCALLPGFGYTKAPLPKSCRVLMARPCPPLAQETSFPEAACCACMQGHAWRHIFCSCVATATEKQGQRQKSCTDMAYLSYTYVFINIYLCKSICLSINIHILYIYEVMMEKPRRIFKPCDAHDKNMRWQRYFNLDHYH